MSVNHRSGSYHMSEWLSEWLQITVMVVITSRDSGRLPETLTHKNLNCFLAYQSHKWLSLYVGKLVIDKSECLCMSDWLSLYFRMVVNHRNVWH